MKTSVDKYRGWEIFFDSEAESFTAYSDHFDRQEKKQSFAAVKKMIDEIMAANSQFKPIKLMPTPGSWKGTDNINLVAIRKDGRFIYEDGKGSKHQLPNYDEKEYCRFNAANVRVLEEAQMIEKQIEELKKKKDALLAEKFQIVTLKEIREELGF